MRPLTFLPIASAALCVLLGSCASPSASSVSIENDDDKSPAYHFSADNCGFEVARDAPPERIVTVRSAMTEVVAALGAADRLVGTAYQDALGSPEDPLVSGEVALGSEQDLAAVLARVPELSDRLPAREAVLAVEPDLVLAGWESAFAADAAGDRAALADIGVTTFVAPAACTDPAYAPDPLTFEDVFAEITQIGELLGTPEEAGLVVAELREELAAAERYREEIALKPATALWWSSASDIPFVGAGAGAPQMIMTAAGLENVAADLPGGWASYSWEAAAAADPDYLVLVSSDRNTADVKREFLESNPVTAAMSAVREERYLVLPIAGTEAGIRNVESVWNLLEQRAELEP